MNKRIGICGIGSISALGHRKEEIWKNYLSPTSSIVEDQDFGAYCAKLSAATELAVKQLKTEDKYYSKVDRSVLLAILAARQAMAGANWVGQTSLGINIGSSRGATDSFERFFSNFQSHPQKLADTLTSPLTTLGNIASWVAHDLEAKGPCISHSITCSSALHALLNGVAWLQAGLAERFLIGASEAPLTAFTIAQMKALKVLRSDTGKEEYPCRAMDLDKKQNTMVLGEGAAAFCLSTKPNQALAYIDGLGYGTEHFAHPTQISPDGQCLQKAMNMALQNIPKNSIDVLITHAPGTKQGDRSELAAIHTVFGKEMPLLTNNKWKIGHTLGASAALSIELALLMMQHNQFIEVPFLLEQKNTNREIRRVMINATGFGGNAVSVVLNKPERR